MDRMLVRALLIMIILVFPSHFIYAENVLDNSTTFQFSLRQENSHNEGVFKLQNYTAIIELIARPEEYRNRLEADMAFSVLTLKPKYNEPMRLGLAIEFDEPEEPYWNEKSDKSNGRAYMLFRYDDENYTIKGFYPVARYFNSEKCYWRIRVENARYYFQNNQDYSLALAGLCEYREDSGLSGGIGFYARKRDFFVQVLSNSISVGWGN